MKEIKLTIDGKEVQLTEEQLRSLGIEIEEKRKNPFDRVAKYNSYYRVTDANQVDDYVETSDGTDNRLYGVANYFNDKQFAKQVALHQLLYRKLLKFAYDNECEDTAEWNGMSKPTYDNTCDNTVEWSRKNQHYSVRYSYEAGDFVMFCQYDDKGQDVYFSSESDAERAINEVIKPFMEEHPEFVW